MFLALAGEVFASTSPPTPASTANSGTRTPECGFKRLSPEQLRAQRASHGERRAVSVGRARAFELSADGRLREKCCNGALQHCRGSRFQRHAHRQSTSYIVKTTATMYHGRYTLTVESEM